MQSIRIVNTRAERVDAKAFLSDCRTAQSRSNNGNKPCVACQMIRRLHVREYMKCLEKQMGVKEFVLRYLLIHGPSLVNAMATNSHFLRNSLSEACSKLYRAGKVGRRNPEKRPKGGQPFIYFLKTS
jgi:predicted transcriptional regulator